MPTNNEIDASEIKKNVRFETIKGICSSYGAIIIGMSITMLVTRRVNAELLKHTNSLKAQELKRLNMDDFNDILGISAFVATLSAPFVGLCGFVSGEYAAWHNTKVDELIQRQSDSFNQRIEQEHAAPKQQSR